MGEPLGRVKLAGGRSLIMPRYLCCSDPGCAYLHRMAVLVRGPEEHQPEGDLYELDEAMLAKLDALAAVLGPYTRVEEALSDGSTAFAYRETERNLRPPAVLHPMGDAHGHVDMGLANEVEHYPRDERPRIKNCCAADLDHAGPHDVVRPFDALRYAEASYRRKVANYSGWLHGLEAETGVTPFPIALALRVSTAISEHRDDPPALAARLKELLEECPPQFQSGPF